MKKYKHLFFDLDRTLWDFNKNSNEAIKELFDKHDLKQLLSTDFDAFYVAYVAKNHEMWDLYRKGEIDKEGLRLERFHQTFQLFGLDDATYALAFNDDYIACCSSKSGLIPHALEMLDYLKPNYTMHIITNGFIEAQEVKLRNSGLISYFDQIIISDGIGFKKPDRRIFEYSLEKAGAKSEDSLMIGDDYGPDVLGAKAIGMDQVFFTPNPNDEESATYVISSLNQLQAIL